MLWRIGSCCVWHICMGKMIMIIWCHSSSLSCPGILSLPPFLTLILFLSVPSFSTLNSLFPSFHFLASFSQTFIFCFFLIIGHILIFSVIIFSDRFYSLFFVNFSVLVFIQFLRFFVFCSSFLFFSLNKLYYSDSHTFFFLNFQIQIQKFKFGTINWKIFFQNKLLNTKKIRKKVRYFKSVLFTEIKTLKE